MEAGSTEDLESKGFWHPGREGTMVPRVTGLTCGGPSQALVPDFEGGAQGTGMRVRGWGASNGQALCPCPPRLQRVTQGLRC